MNNRTLTFNVLLIFISPLLVLVNMIKTRNIRGKRFLFTALVMIYGITLPLPKLADGFRHRQMVIDEYVGMSWSRFTDDFQKILSFEISSSSTDVYKHVISYISGGVFEAPFLFFLIVSSIYGYFYSGAILELFKNYRNSASSKGFLFWSFVLLFFLVKNAEGIQTVRTWTGAWILFYAVFMYTKTKKIKYVILLFFPPLIHFGYFIMALPAYLVILFGNRNTLWSVIFVLSTFLNFYDPNTLSSNFKGFSLIEQKFEQYERSEEELTGQAQLERLNQRIKQERTWYKKLQVFGYFKWTMNFLMFILIFFRIPKKFMDRLEQRLFFVGVAMLASSNILFFIFAASNRMHIIGIMFVFASIILLFLRSKEFNDYQRYHLRFRLLIFAYFFLAIPQFIYLFSFFLSQISMYFIVSPLVPVLFPETNLAIIDVIKFLSR